MYNKILVPLENTKTDKAILAHIRELANLTKAHLILIHVADGWAARNYNNLNLAESDEIKADRNYLETQAAALISEGFSAESILRMGDPVNEIVKAANENKVNLIAMATHGHKLISDIIYGNTADKVRHNVKIPVLMVPGKKK